MYRFNREDNERARGFFEMAVRLDPTFARAYAGLSIHSLAKRLPRFEADAVGVFKEAAKRIGLD